MSAPLDFISSQHQSAPKFMALVNASLAPFQDCIALLDEMNTTTFDLDSATGAQLDTLGLWIGASRNLDVPIPGVFFSFDDPNLGFDNGYWDGYFEPSVGVTTLDDDNYRQLLRVRVLNNQWDGSVNRAYEIDDAVFGSNSMLAYIKSNGNMTITIGLLSTTTQSALLKQMFQSGAISFRPAAVGVAEYKFVQHQFGFGTDFAGFGDGDFWS